MPVILLIMEEEVCDSTLLSPVIQNSQQSPLKRKRKQIARKKLKVDKQDNERDNTVVSESCPICQVPLSSLRILPESHVNNCDVVWQDLPECKNGQHCTETSVFHFRDYSHIKLAAIRSTVEVSTIMNLKNRQFSENLPIDVNTASSIKNESDTKFGKCFQVSSSKQESFLPFTNSDNCMQQTKLNFSFCQNYFSQQSKESVELKIASLKTEVIQETEKKMVDGALTQKELNQIKISDSKERKEAWKNLMNHMRGPVCVDTKSPVSKSFKNPECQLDGQVTNIAVTKKTCPFYKRIPGTTFVVDAFNYGIIPGVSAYFLTHFHSDHYIGLRKIFTGVIYCSEITAALVKKKIGVKDEQIIILPLNETRSIGKVLVTPLDANHCPGSIMLLFQMTDGSNVLHVGDFRYAPSMKMETILKYTSIHKLFLDTTYCDPKYDFPPQEQIIEKVVKITMSTLLTIPKTLVVCGSYLIGKEKVFKGILKALGAKLWARADKRSILKSLCDSVISNALVTKPELAHVHVLPMKDINHRSLRDHLLSLNGAYSHILAFRPTGWELSSTSMPSTFKESKSDNIWIYGVPYSEHSSFSELREFVQFINPKEILPTVNVSKHVVMQQYFSNWLQESQKI